MKLKRLFSVSVCCLTIFSAMGQVLCDKTDLSIGDVVTLTAPQSEAKSVRWTLPKGYRLIGELTDRTVRAEVTYYAQSGDVKLVQQMADDSEAALSEAIRVQRPISLVKDHTINDGGSVMIGGIERSDADIYYEAMGDGQITAHRVTVLPLSNRKVMRPYLQTVKDKSVYVNWKSSVKESATVRFGVSKESLDRSVEVTNDALSLNYFWYSASLTGLEPNTIYYYQVESAEAYSESGGCSEVFRFKTAPSVGENRKSRVLLMGDHQIKTRSGYEWLLQAAKRKVEEKYGQSIEEAIDVVLNVGDQVDLGTLQQYEEIHLHKSQLLSPYVATMTAIGNHETYSDPGLNNYARHFHYENLEYCGIKSDTENYYAYQLGRTLYVYLSTEHTGSTQKAWVRKVVDAAKTDETVDFIVSVNHRPVQAEQYIGDISTWVRNEIVPILSETPKHVLNYGGHHHLYHRGQFPNFPLYHIINGAASWDQMWGMSSEMDYDDVQKTIDYWTYQIVEFDYDTKIMRVECYAIGHKLMVADNILIDTFERQLASRAPNQPVLDEVDAVVNLPYTLSSSEYASESGFALNTVQYQVSMNSDFSLLSKNVIRDVENLYGSTKDPLYLPIDLHEGMDITRLELAEKSLKNGVYYLRVRYRDTNMEWSEWSESRSFEVQGSVAGDPGITIAKQVYALGENIVVDYAFAPEGKNAWIGLYKKGDLVGPTASTLWKYTSGATGQLNLGKLSNANEYFIVLFADAGYIEITARIPIYVGPTLTFGSVKSEYEPGEKIQIVYDNAPALSKDWVGVYRVGTNPAASNPSLLWQYATTAAGTLEFNNSLSNGYYYATYMLRDGYFEPTERTYFSVGTKISTIESNKSVYAEGEDVVITYGAGPGTPKDWIGLYKEGKDVEVDELDGFYYTYGETDGTITIPTADIAPGRYFISFFINDSYTEVSERIYITIGGITTVLPTSPAERSPIVYPNPFDSELLCDNATGAYDRIVVSTLVGTPVQSELLTAGRNIIHVGSLSAGTYVVTLIGGEENKSTLMVKR